LVVRRTEEAGDVKDDGADRLLLRSTIKDADASNLLDALVATYDRLPEGICSELPPKRIWALVLED
jgi:predicted Mrr-cat superfamily restriction endonuclease